MLDFLTGSTSPIVTNDNYSVPSHLAGSNGCRVKIECPGKGRTIYAMLSRGFSIDGKSEWKGLFQSALGGDMGLKVLDIADNIMQTLSGKSIRQPYFGRKYWCGSQPLRFSLTFQFVSFSNAKVDVFNPMIDLLALVFPRLDGNGDTAGAFSKFFIPGPNLFYNSKSGASKDDGDRVESSMGNFLYFRGCYLHSVKFTVENSFSTDGYPNCVDATIDFETMDVAFVEGDNSFMRHGFKDPSVDLGEQVQKMKELAANTVQLATKMVKSGAGAVSDGASAASEAANKFLSSLKN